MNKTNRFRRFLTWLNCMALGIAMVYNQHSSASPSSDVQTLAVAYLYNFMKLSEWPTGAASQELTLCITQEGDFAKELDSLTGKEAQNHSLKIRRIIQGDNVRECQLLFLPSEEKPVRIQEWIKSLRNEPVLTVSDLDGFLDQGGMIALVNDDGHLQFEVNLEVVEQAGIKLSSKMLQIARDVRGK